MHRNGAKPINPALRYERKISKEDARALFIKYDKTRDRKLRNQLINNYLYIPKVLSIKYGRSNGDNEDIFQVACLSLIHAVNRFDPKKGYEFDTFATPTIVGQIKRHYRDHESLIRIPRKIQDLNRDVNRTRTMLEHQLMRSPSILEISNYLGISEESIIESMEINNAYYPKSLSMKYQNGTDGTEVCLMDLLGSPDDNIENVENIDLLKKKIQALNSIEKMVIGQRFFNEKTQKEVGILIKKSQMTVSRIEKKAIQKLKADF